MAYLSLCKLKQKWLPVSPFMLKKKKVFKASGEVEISLSFHSSSPPFGDGGLRILPRKVTRIEITTVQSNETHNTNKVGKKECIKS